MPKRIAIPNIALFIFNPLIFLALIISGVTLVVLNPLSPHGLVIIIFVAGLLIFSRQTFIELLIDNVILFCALVTFTFKRRYVAWEK